MSGALHSGAVRVRPADQGFDASQLQAATLPDGPKSEALPGGAVRINPPDRGYNADELKERRKHLLQVDMQHGDPEIRKQHVAMLKTQKQIATAMPSIEAYWAKVVGPTFSGEAMTALSNEADAEIARENAEAQLAAAAKRRG